MTELSQLKENVNYLVTNKNTGFFNVWTYKQGWLRINGLRGIDPEQFPSDVCRIAELRPTRPLICSCCGAETVGRQWWNRDTGYGLCEKCVEFVSGRESAEEIKECYGLRGVHYDLGFLKTIGKPTPIFSEATMTIRQAPQNYLLAMHNGNRWVCEPDLAADKELATLVFQTLMNHSDKYSKEGRKLAAKILSLT